MKNIKQQSRRRFIKLSAAGTALAYSPFIFGTSSFGILENEEVEKFLTACQDGEIELVKKMLSADSNLRTAKDNFGRSGFAIALLSGHRNVGDFLIESGYQTDLHETVLDLNWDRFEELIGEESTETESQVNANHPIGGSLMWAAAAGGAGKDIWRVYAKCGNPNGNPRKELGSTPLQKALLYSDLKIAELTAASLLSNDTNPNPLPNAEKPPLHIAAERGSLEMVEMLIRLGADVNIKDKKGRNAAQLADYSGQKLVFELLKNHEQIPRTCRTSRTAFDMEGNPYTIPDMSDIPLYLRSKVVGQSHRNFEALQKAVAADSRMAHAVATTSETAVEAGAHMGNKNIVEYLMKNGAPYSLPTAVLMNDFTTVRKMLDEDPNRIHERGAHDFALLWYPIIGGGNLEMTQLLLDRGAKVEEQHFLGTTALHWACMRGPIELVEMLVKNGADVNRLGRKFSAEGKAPLQFTKDEKIINYLKNKGARL